MKFWCQQEHLVTSVICCKFQRYLFEVWFYIFFFMILYMNIAPRQGQTAPRGRSFDFNRNVLSLHSFVASFKKMSLKSDFIHFFHDLIHVYSPRAGADSPQGTKFWCQQKGFITLPICCKFKKKLASAVLAVSKEKGKEVWKCWIWVTFDEGQWTTLTFDIHTG